MSDSLAVDAAVDARRDGAADAGRDAARDSAVDAARDGAVDAARDGAVDAAPPDAAPRCTPDGGVAPAVMVPVAAGYFSMGCDPVSDPDCTSTEQPLHQVFLSAYEIDSTEVTQGQYEACVEAGGCTAPSCGAAVGEWDPCGARADYPAICVTWDQAKTYCTWAGKRLPTEAEWEKAARGASDTRLYPWGDDPPTCVLANLEGCGDVLEPVASHAAGISPYGAYDMAGNVVELVHDWWSSTYYADFVANPVPDPQGPAIGTRLIGRGGGYRSVARYLRAADRDVYDTGDTSVRLGFRCAR
jgi:formylglycine-generating enzyme required for sulfatase activity